MSVFSQLSFKAKVLLLPITFLVSLIAIGLLVSATISKVKVGGPEYAKIQEQKDLLADTIPPPGYVLEAYLNLHLMENAENEAERDRCIERFHACRADFEKCQAKWDVSLPKGKSIPSSPSKPIYPPRSSSALRSTSLSSRGEGRRLRESGQFALARFTISEKLCQACKHHGCTGLCHREQSLEG